MLFGEHVLQSMTLLSGMTLDTPHVPLESFALHAWMPSSLCSTSGGTVPGGRNTSYRSSDLVWKLKSKRVCSKCLAILKL